MGPQGLHQVRPLTGSASGERADILETLRTHRYFLRHTVEGLTDEQARPPRRPAS